MKIWPSRILQDWSAKVGQWLFADLLTYCGFLKKAKILFLGLDNAGKTTLLYMLTEDNLKQLEPTGHPTSNEIVIDQVTMKIYDLGGHQNARRLWSDYSADVNGVVFVVDAADRERFREASVELGKALALNHLENVPFLVLGNKIDLPSAASEEELKYYLGLTNSTTGKAQVKLDDGIRPIEVFMCSIARRVNYGEGFIWLTSHFK